MLLSLLMIAVFASAPAQATSLGTNLIVNPGAEADTGATDPGAASSNISATGWTKSAPPEARATVVQYQTTLLPDDEWPRIADPGPPDRGDNFFSGGDEDRSSISQTFDVSDLDIQIDDGLVNFDLEGWFGGWLFQEDYATLTALFFDGDGSEIAPVVPVSIGGVTAGNRGNQTALLLRSMTGEVPDGTREIKLLLESVRVEGFSNDGYADNLSFVLTVIPEPSTALLLGMGLTGLGVFGSRSRR
jgi:hypothetical protein